MIPFVNGESIDLLICTNNEECECPTCVAHGRITSQQEGPGYQVVTRFDGTILAWWEWANPKLIRPVKLRQARNGGLIPDGYGMIPVDRGIRRKRIIRDLFRLFPSFLVAADRRGTDGIPRELFDKVDEKRGEGLTAERAAEEVAKEYGWSRESIIRGYYGNERHSTKHTLEGPPAMVALQLGKAGLLSQITKNFLAQNDDRDWMEAKVEIKRIDVPWEDRSGESK